MAHHNQTIDLRWTVAELCVELDTHRDIARALERRIGELRVCRVNRKLIVPRVLEATKTTNLPVPVTNVDVCGGKFVDYTNQRKDYSWSVTLTYTTGNTDVYVQMRDDTIQIGPYAPDPTCPEHALAIRFWEMLGKNAGAYMNLDPTIFRRGDPEWSGTK